MSDTLHLEVLTPEKKALETEVSSVYLQASEGRLGILPMHTALIAKLDVGEMAIAADGKTETLLCGAGLVEVRDNRVTVLARSVERPEEIDVDRAKEAQARAKARLHSKDEGIDMDRAEVALKRAIHRIRFAGRRF